MLSMQLTEWFPPEVTPVHAGVYEVKGRQGFENMGIYSYWNGTAWQITAPTRHQAYRNMGSNPPNVYTQTSLQKREWRGLGYVGE